MELSDHTKIIGTIGLVSVSIAVVFILVYVLMACIARGIEYIRQSNTEEND